MTLPVRARPSTPCLLRVRVLIAACFATIAAMLLVPSFAHDSHPDHKYYQGMVHPARAGEKRDLGEDFHHDVDETTISAGFQHSCVVDTDPGAPFGGPIRCWGMNNKGQCDVPPGTYVQVSAGRFHTCGLTIDEQVRCWGAAGIGISPKGEFTQVSAGSVHTCAVRKDGTVKCWGKNYEGQSKPPAGRFVQVSCGKDHSCGIRTDGTGECWGSNHWHEREVPEGHQWVQLSASEYHSTCGIDADGTTLCWGANGFGQSIVPDDAMFVQVSTGRKYTCGIHTDATVHCWGNGGNFGATQPPEGVAFVQISSGYQHSCGITTTGTAVCWGNGVAGVTIVPEGVVPAL